MSFFGFNIKKIRTVKKLNQSQFAQLFDLTRSAVGAYEEGRAEAKIDKIIEIADYFGLTLDQFLKKKLTLNEIFKYDSTKALLNYSNTFEPIDFIEHSKFNQYLKNYENNEYVSRLPKIFLPLNNKNLRAFEILNSNTIFDGDVIICEKFETAKPYDLFFFVINDQESFILEKLPPKKLYLQIWKIVSVVNKNTYKYKIFDKLKNLNYEK